jgi:hypothetical protein
LQRSFNRIQLPNITPAFVIYHEHFLSIIPPPRYGANADFMRRSDGDILRNVLEAGETFRF